MSAPPAAPTGDATMTASAWRIALAATALMAVGMGLRIAGGLFVSPLNGATGLGLATLSLLFASGQLAQGLALPFIGAWADRVGAARVVQLGALALAAATLLLAASAWWPRGGIGAASVLTMATVAAAVLASAVANGAVGSNALMVGEVNRRLRPEQAALAVGFVSAGGSLGQLVLGPATQAAIDHFGWSAALGMSAVVALLAWPLARMLRSPPQPGLAPQASGLVGPSADTRSPATPLRQVLRDARYWRVAASFGICGFHVSFLAVHMPGVIERCGLPSSLAGPWIALAGAANIAGSLAMGHAMRRRDHARLLAAMYLLRALGVAAFLTTVPDILSLMLFALVMGVSHMATLPPTAQLVARHHGIARLSSLLGLVMLVHQVGGFAGIWLGGWAAEATGDDRLLWLVDIVLALAAAALVWPLREVRRQAEGIAPRRRRAKADAGGIGKPVAQEVSARRPAPVPAPCAAPQRPGAWPA